MPVLVQINYRHAMRLLFHTLILHTLTRPGSYPQRNGIRLKDPFQNSLPAVYIWRKIWKRHLRSCFFGIFLARSLPAPMLQGLRMPFRQFQHARSHRRFCPSLTCSPERYRSLGLILTQRRDRRYSVFKVQSSVLQWKRLRIQNIIEPNRYTGPVDRSGSLILRVYCSAAKRFRFANRRQKSLSTLQSCESRNFSWIHTQPMFYIRSLF